jgi:pimeloyl-ACP methyl ester carboxylesterase
MPYAITDDGVKLYFEETGSGTPTIFVHEFAGDHRSWEPQLRHFGQRYRAITMAHAAIHRPTCRTTRPDTPKTAPRAISPRC